MHSFLLLPALLAAPLAPSIQTPSSAAAAQAPAPQTEAARVPVHPNSTCPIMGKPVSLKLFADTGRGRIWVCCKSCIADIHADVDLAYRTAYPVVVEVATGTCPVTGKGLREDSPFVELQGLRFRVLDDAAAKRAIAESQVTIARVREPGLVDVGNTKCPVDGKAVAANAFVVIDGRIVRLSSPKHVEEARKDPRAALARALEIAGKGR